MKSADYINLLPRSLPPKSGPGQGQFLSAENPETIHQRYRHRMFRNGVSHSQRRGRQTELYVPERPTFPAASAGGRCATRNLLPTEPRSAGRQRSSTVVAGCVQICGRSKRDRCACKKGTICKQQLPLCLSNKLRRSTEAWSITGTWWKKCYWSKFLLPLSVTIPAELLADLSAGSSTMGPSMTAVTSDLSHVTLKL